MLGVRCDVDIFKLTAGAQSIYREVNAFYIILWVIYIGCWSEKKNHSMNNQYGIAFSYCHATILIDDPTQILPIPRNWMKLWKLCVGKNPISIYINLTQARFSNYVYEMPVNFEEELHLNYNDWLYSLAYKSKRFDQQYFAWRMDTIFTTLDVASSATEQLISIIMV